MNIKLTTLIAASALALAACNSPTAEQKADEAAVSANAAGAEAAQAASAAGDAAVASAEAAGAATAAAAGATAAAVDAAADPVQAAYEEGKANAAGAVANAADRVSAEMRQESGDSVCTLCATPTPRGRLKAGCSQKCCKNCSVMPASKRRWIGTFM